MTEPVSRIKIILARLTVMLMIVFFIIGIIWYGFSEQVRQRMLQNLLERPAGMMSFRFILQPIMAAIAAIIDGIRDARTGKPPYFWMLIFSSEGRLNRLREGILSTARIILLGMCMDGIYQYYEFKAFFPVEAVVIALSLAFLPYLLLRGLFARAASWWLNRSKNNSH